MFSAFLVNDAFCLVLAPLVLESTLRMGQHAAEWRQLRDAAE